MFRFISRSLRFTAIALIVAMVWAPTAASARSMYFSKSSGTMAAVSWLEVGELPPAANAPGNAHFGDLWVEQTGKGRADAFGTVYDVQCEEGVTPYNPGGGHHAEFVDEKPPEDGPCQLLGMRFMKGRSLSFTLGKRLSKATLTGALEVGSGHGEGPVGTPQVNITWNGVGTLYKSTESGRYTDADGTYSYRYVFTGRDAVIGAGSRIGPMIFDDEAGEYSEAQLGSYRSAERARQG